ncbi:pyruvate formate lyase family protein [uncultured Megasphaera sp.]|uniref:glycyl radical protein n=1 Tax=uncultured Megasphaera sp. TaxID=165188 RepID=UPI002658088B|nr:pyruvate formate lyase family protein [uncultured Megasphaera sp.]
MLTARIQKAKDEYVNNKPAISYDRARIWTESYKKTEGQSAIMRRAQAFKDVCEQLVVTIFPGELIVGAVGEFRKCGILTPEFSWTWVDREMDHFSDRVQDPYEMTDEQRAYVRKNIFPYWKGKSLEEAYLSQIPAETAKVAVDTGIVDIDSKWRQSVGEITPDYQDVLLKKGFRGIIATCQEKMAALKLSRPGDLKKMEFYQSVILCGEGMITLAHRYADTAEAMAAAEVDSIRKAELEQIASICRRVPELPPQTFQEALQMIWFYQLGGILMENPLSLNPGRFDQYMYPFYQYDKAHDLHDDDGILELIECYWLKLSEWVWTISANTADFFAGYNQFQNLTVGGSDRHGKDATNELSYLALKATAEVKTHQPGLSVRISQQSPRAFVDAVMELVAQGTGFPAIHSDKTGYQMLKNLGYDTEDARDWNNCGCVVPHFRKTFEWTSTVNVNFSGAFEYATNGGKSRLTGKQMGLPIHEDRKFSSYEDVEHAFMEQFDNLIDISVTGTLIAQKLQKEMIPRPYFSALFEDCLESGKDLVDGGAKYNVGPVLTGIGLAESANSLAAIKKLVFEDKVCTMEDILDAMDKNWEGYEKLRRQAQNAPKYGNDDDFVDDIAQRIANHFYEQTHQYTDIYGSPFTSAFMGISNFIPTGRVIGATACGRKAGEPISEGVSPVAGTDTSTPIAAMNSCAKMNQDIHSGGTLLNMRLSHDLVSTKRGRSNLAAMVQSFFDQGAFHVQFNTLSTKTLLDAQAHPEQYKDLLVRVAGYSTQFVHLSKTLQDSIIRRSAHDGI